MSANSCCFKLLWKITQGAKLLHVGHNGPAEEISMDADVMGWYFYTDKKKCMDSIGSHTQGTTYIGPCILAVVVQLHMVWLLHKWKNCWRWFLPCNWFCSATFQTFSSLYRCPLWALCELINAKYFGKEAIWNSTWPSPWTSLWNVSVDLSLPAVFAAFPQWFGWIPTS